MIKLVKISRKPRRSLLQPLSAGECFPSNSLEEINKYEIWCDMATNELFVREHCICVQGNWYKYEVE